MKTNNLKIKHLNESHTGILSNSIDDSSILPMLNIIEKAEDLENDEVGSAYGLFLDDELIGAIAYGMLDDLEDTPYIISGVVIFKDYRGKGYAEDFLNETFRLEVDNSYDGYLYADVIDYKIGAFYEHIGFTTSDNCEYKKKYKY